MSVEPNVEEKQLALQKAKEREKKILNCMINSSIILMSSLMGAFSEIMVNATSTFASGFAEALDDEEVKKKAQEEFSDADKKVMKLISDTRQDIYRQFEQKKKEIKPLIADPVFDEGPHIVENYDFGLPKLTEELDDLSLAAYTQLIASDDKRFDDMFKQLMGWMNSLPKSPPLKANKSS